MNFKKPIEFSNIDIPVFPKDIADKVIIVNSAKNREKKYKLLYDHILEVPITSEMKQIAEQLRVTNQFENKHSLVKGDALYHGFIGEVIFYTVFPNADRANTYDYDFMFNGEKVDIKTKSVNSIPRMNFDCSVMDYSLRIQKCEKYVFVRINKELTTGWILGIINKPKFILKAVNNTAGSFDPSNQFRCLKGKYDVKVFDLNSMKEYL